MHKVSRSQFYEYKRAFQLHGLDGLIDMPPIPGDHIELLARMTQINHMNSLMKTAK